MSNKTLATLFMLIVLLSVRIECKFYMFCTFHADFDTVLRGGRNTIGFFWAQKTEFGSHEGVLLVEVLLRRTNGLDGIWLMKSHEGQKWVLRVIYGS